MDEATTARFRDRLEAMLAALTEEDRATAVDRAPVELDQTSVGRLSRMDALQVQAMAEAQSRRRVAEKARIRAALARMSEDEFGWCQDCGEAIGTARLELDPAAPFCVDCARG
ncbi:MAG: TraR/DksA family transcriptional regulator [Paracoccaceae bacterium]